MLTGYDVQIVAFSPDDDAAASFCRACTVKELGEPAVARLEVGLTTGTRWSALSRYEVDHAAVEWGYERPGGCGPDSDGRPCEAAQNENGMFCAACAQQTCHDCCERLDTPPEEVAGDE